MYILFIIFGIVIVIGFCLLFGMYLRDKRKTTSASTKRRLKTPNIPSYELSSWIDDEVAARKLYRKPDLSVAELADELGISERRLRHAINNAYNKTVSEYLNDRRIQAACQMLCKQPYKRVEDIGTDVGFASIPAFRKLFVRTMGQTPDQYRQMINNSKYGTTD